MSCKFTVLDMTLMLVNTVQPSGRGDVWRVSCVVSCCVCQELRLYGALQRPECSGEQVALLYPLPYTQEHPPPPLIQQRPADLQYGNPYARGTVGPPLLSPPLCVCLTVSSLPLWVSV